MKSITNRKFLARSVAKRGDTSGWTETPADKRRKYEEEMIRRELAGPPSA